MAATEGAGNAKGNAWGPVLAAALLLPGIAPAQVPDGPGPATIAFKWLSYRDWQPELDRIQVRSPALLLSLPVGDRWGVDASVTTDSVSGASPRYHSSVSGASRMNDLRRAGDVRLTRYNDRQMWSVGLAASDEHDFRSRAVSAQVSWASDDNNRSWRVGLGYRADQIGSSDAASLNEQRRTIESQVSVTQALSPQDLVQAVLTHSAGEGYFGDPYKTPDLRPGSRHQTSATVRWNHHFESWQTTLRASYRFYKDSFGVQSHTATLEPVVAIGSRVTLTPSVRLYSQGAANFYYNPRYRYTGVPYPVGYFDRPLAFISADQRLSAFGALTVGIKIGLALSGGWSTDLKVERYEQRSAWHLRSEGSRGLAPFSASIVQWGVSRQF